MSEHHRGALSKQIELYVQIQSGAQRGHTSVIREGVRFARGFGMTKHRVLGAMSWGSLYGGTEARDFAYRAGDNLLDARH